MPISRAYKMVSSVPLLSDLSASSLVFLLLCIPHTLAATSTISFSSVHEFSASSEFLHPASSDSWAFSEIPLSSQTLPISYSVPPTVFFTTSATSTATSTASDVPAQAQGPPSSLVFLAVFVVAGAVVLVIVIFCGIQCWRRRRQRNIPPSALYRQSVAVGGDGGAGPVHGDTPAGSTVGIVGARAQADPEMRESATADVHEVPR